MKKNRRQFLKNVTLGIIGTGIAPVIARTNYTNSSEIQQNCIAVTEDFYGEGPFYTENPPEILNGMLASESEPGQRLIISGIVKNLDCLEIIPNTEIDIWHADNSGSYSSGNDYTLRGKTYTNSQGFYSIETIFPGKYLNAGQFRPRHFHFKITPPGFPTFTTQTYFQGDSDLAGDPASSVNSGQYDATNRILPYTVNAQGTIEVTWDIVVDGNGVLGVDNLHLNNGMIYSISPNPFEDEITINYGVFKTADIKIEIYNLNGVLVANINKSQLTPEKYTAIWKPEKELSSGIYFCALKMNDIQVHYQKIIKK